MKTEAELRSAVLSQVRQIITHSKVFTDERPQLSASTPILFPIFPGARDDYRLTITLEEFDKIAEILLPPCPSTAEIAEDGVYGDTPYWEVSCDQRVGHMLEHHAVVKQGTVTVEFKWTDLDPS